MGSREFNNHNITYYITNMKTRYTFDRGHIQNDVTGNFVRDIEVTERCKAFTGQTVKEHRILIGADKTVRVWDGIAGHYTTCHALSKSTQRRIVKKHVK